MSDPGCYLLLGSSICWKSPPPSKLNGICLPAMPVSLASTLNYIVFGNMQRETAGKTLFIASILPHNNKLVFFGWSPQGHIISGYAAHVHGLSVTERDLDALIKTISNAVEMDTTSVEIGFGLHYLIRMLKRGQLRSWELRGRNKYISLLCQKAEICTIRDATPTEMQLLKAIDAVSPSAAGFLCQSFLSDLNVLD